MDSSTSLPSIATKPVFCARPGGVLLFHRLRDKAELPALADALGPLPADVAAGALTNAADTKALVLFWAAPEQMGDLAEQLGPRDLGIWPGHLHCDGDYTPLAGHPHLSLAGLQVETVPSWLLDLIVGVRV